MGKNEEWLERDKNALASVLPRCSDSILPFCTELKICNYEKENTEMDKPLCVEIVDHIISSQRN